MVAIAYVALGSNLGDRQSIIQEALRKLREGSGIHLTRFSSVYETAPVGGPGGQGAYLNAVAEIETTLEPDRLLEELLNIESQLGRVRVVKDGPRTLDLDLLFYEDRIIETENLIVPHPRLHQRLFVLEPLSEIAPGLIHPLLGKSIQNLRGDILGVSSAAPRPGRELVGLKVLVTGSSSGIGEAIALELAAGGADVILHGRTHRPAIDFIAKALNRHGGKCHFLMADLRDQKECLKLAEEAWNCWDGLDVLINNAGADTLTGHAAQWNFDRKLEELWRVDVHATVTLAREIGARMKARKKGVILNMGWDQAETGMEGDSGELFCLSKGAIMAFSRALALSLAPEVRVHCLAPGWIRTKWGETAPDNWQERVRKETPQQRWGTPVDVARAARWLVSPGSNYLTGQIVRVNGGAIR